MSKLKPTIDFGYPTEAQGEVPSFANIEEEAEFWDTHDFTDSMSSTEPVRLPRNQQRIYQIVVTLGMNEHRELEALAKEIGISPNTLAHRWIAERMRQEIAEQLQPAPEVEHGAADEQSHHHSARDRGFRANG